MLLMEAKDVQFAELDHTETHRYGFSLTDYQAAGVPRENQIATVVCSKRYVKEGEEKVLRERVIVSFVQGVPIEASRSGEISACDKGLGQRLMDFPEGLRDKVLGEVPTYASNLLRYAMSQDE